MTSRAAAPLARPAAAALAAALAVWPSVAAACAVCGGFSARNREAFFWMTIFMSLLPLAVIVAGVWWLRRNMRFLAGEFRERADVRESAPAADEPAAGGTPAP